MKAENALAFLFFFAVALSVFLILALLPGSPLPGTNLGTSLYLATAVSQAWSWHRARGRRE
jgi:hypothetical protein